MSLPKLKLEQIRVDQRTQLRVAGLQNDVVEEYAEAMREGAVFPAVEVFYDGSVYWLADGFHRVEAYRRLQVDVVEVIVRDGTQREAMLHAMQANLRHGLRVTREDRRNAVQVLLQDPEWSKWSDREIGRRCGVDGKTVAAVRRDLGQPLPTTRTMLRAGREVEIDTGNIGARTAATTTAEFPQSGSVELSTKDLQKAAKIASDYGWSLDDARVFVQCQLSKRQQDAARRQQRREELERVRKQVARKIRKDLPEQKRSRLQSQLQVVTELARQYEVPASVVLAVLQQDTTKKR